MNGPSANGIFPRGFRRARRRRSDVAGPFVRTIVPPSAFPPPPPIAETPRSRRWRHRSRSRRPGAQRSCASAGANPGRARRAPARRAGTGACVSARAPARARRRSSRSAARTSSPPGSAKDAAAASRANPRRRTGTRRMFSSFESFESSESSESPSFESSSSIIPASETSARREARLACTRRRSRRRRLAPSSSPPPPRRSSREPSMGSGTSRRAPRGWFASTYWNSEAARRIARDASPSRTRVSPANPPWRRVRLASVHRFCGSLTHGHASAAPRKITGSRACPSYPANVRARSANRASVRVASAQSISGTAPTTRTSRDRRGGRRSGTSASTSGETASKTRAVTASRRASSDASSETSRRSPENDAGARREEDASASSSSAPTSDVSRTDRGTERAARARPRGFGKWTPA